MSQKVSQPVCVLKQLPWMWHKEQLFFRLVFFRAGWNFCFNLSCKTSEDQKTRVVIWHVATDCDCDKTFSIVLDMGLIVKINKSDSCLNMMK